MKDIFLSNVEQLGARIRLKRKEKGLSQASLAQQLGVERKWILRLEAGNPKAELGLVLQAFHTLGVRLVLEDAQTQTASRNSNDRLESPIDEVFARLDRPTRK